MQIHDHRSANSSSQSSSSSIKLEKNVPFSVHNHNPHLTPSPFVPHPELSKAEAAAKEVSAKDTPSSDTTNGVATVKIEKENQPPSEQPSTVPSSVAKNVRTFTTVLFPTPLSLQQEVFTEATTPNLRSNHRKQSQADSRVPGSTTLTQPPTPLSAVTPTPSSIGPPLKRQKMRISGADVAHFEAKLLTATSAPLFLEPAENLQDCENIAKALQDPLAMNKPPAPKARKKTSAELAADDALAAESQRFMLLMDERLEPSADAASGSGPNDGHAGATAFAPRFERFKAIEEIKLAHTEKARRSQEAKEARDQQVALDKAKQEQAQRENVARQQLQMGQAQAQAQAKHRHEQLQEIQFRQAAAQQAQHQANLNTIALQQQGQQLARPQAHGPTPSGILNNAHHAKVSQAMHSSPIMRNGTPQNNASSPLIGDSGMGQVGMSVPMGLSTSSQGAGSPSRPGSAMQHGHPTPAAMAAHLNQVQPPSRNGTPRMPNGTPGLRQATPAQRHTPTPHMSYASPAASAMAGTPILGQTVMATPQLNGQPLNAQQQMYIQQQQEQFRQQQIRAQQRQLMEQQMLSQRALQGSPPNAQMSPRNQQLLQLQMQNQPQGATNQELYRLQLQSMHNTQEINQQQLQAAQQAAVNRAAAQNPNFQFNQQGQRIVATPNPNNSALAHARAQQQAAQKIQQQQQHAAAVANGVPQPGQPGVPPAQQAARQNFAQQLFQKKMQEAWPHEMENLHRQYGPQPPVSAVNQAKQLLSQRCRTFVHTNWRSILTTQQQARMLQQNGGQPLTAQQRQMAALQAQQHGGMVMGNNGGAMGMMQGIQAGMVGGGGGQQGGGGGNAGMGGIQGMTREQQQQQFALQQQAHQQAQAQQQMMHFQQQQSMGGL